MVFSSTTFLLAFLPLVGILYFICPRKLRNALLLVFSLLFYGWGEPKYILIMLFSTVFDYCNGLAIGHFRAVGKPKGAKAVLVVSVVGNLSILGFFKYTDFAITNLNGLLGTAIPALGLLLPIGISFYTFQTMSYTIDVYRGLVPPQRNIIDFSAYVTLFPQLIAGPIVQYKTVAADLENRNRESLAGASAGMQRFVIANSDNAADQALKLQVRDAVLARAEAILRESADMNDARRRLTDALPAIGDAAAAELAAQHRDDPISVSLEEAEFPLKAYDGFALPSGGYLALRVVIGAGEGRNWWCVVYPPLCTAAASDLSRTALDAGLTEDDLSLITGDGDGYVLRFRSLELWERLRQWLGK